MRRLVRRRARTSGSQPPTPLHHDDVVWTAAFSPDGRRLATAGADRTIIVWRLPAGTADRRLLGHDLTVWSVAFSPDGRLLASGSFDHSVVLWSVDTGAVVHRLIGHTQAVVDLAFSPDGKLLVTGGDDGAVQLWRPATGECVRVLSTPLRHVYALAFTPDGAYLAAGTRDRGTFGEVLQNLFGSRDVQPTVRLWRASDWAEAGTYGRQHDDVHGVAFSPDGRWLATASGDHTAVLWGVDRRPRREHSLKK